MCLCNNIIIILIHCIGNSNKQVTENECSTVNSATIWSSVQSSAWFSKAGSVFLK